MTFIETALNPQTARERIFSSAVGAIFQLHPHADYILDAPTLKAVRALYTGSDPFDETRDFISNIRVTFWITPDFDLPPTAADEDTLECEVDLLHWLHAPYRLQKCIQCARLFKTPRNTAKTCSNNCRQLHHTRTHKT